METLELKKVSIVLTRNLLRRLKLEIQERIVYKADEMFRRYGIKSVTIDDISKQLGVSKKTLYQYYPDKDELVGSVMELNMKKQRECMDTVCGGSVNAVEEMLNVEKMMIEVMSGINPSMLYDMQKYHPNSWFQYTDFKEKYALEQIKTNLNRGIEEGLYRPDIHVDFAAKFRLATIDMAFSGDIFNPQQYTLQDIMKQLTNLFLHGLVTLKGHKMINKYRNLKEEE